MVASQVWRRKTLNTSKHTAGNVNTLVLRCNATNQVLQVSKLSQSSNVIKSCLKRHQNRMWEMFTLLLPPDERSPKKPDQDQDAGDCTTEQNWSLS